MLNGRLNAPKYVRRTIFCLHVPPIHDPAPDLESGRRCAGKNSKLLTGDLMGALTISRSVSVINGEASFRLNTRYEAEFWS